MSNDAPRARQSLEEMGWQGDLAEYRDFNYNPQTQTQIKIKIKEPGCTSILFVLLVAPVLALLAACSAPPMVQECKTETIPMIANGKVILIQEQKCVWVTPTPRKA
jgi:hypothetical protein